MRPVRFTYTPADASLTRFASNVTGATWTLTNTTTSDGYAHTVTIRNDSGTDHSGKTALLTGTNADGYAQTETMALPGASLTTTSTKYFKTLTSIVPSATIGADTMDIGQGAGFASGVIGLDWRSGIVGFTAVVSGTINYTIQYTASDIQDEDDHDFNWLSSDDAAVVGATTSKSSNFVAVPMGMRFIANSQSGSPSIELTVFQRNT